MQQTGSAVYFGAVLDEIKTTSKYGWYTMFRKKTPISFVIAAAFVASMLSISQNAQAATSKDSVDSALQRQYTTMVKAVLTNNVELAVSLYDDNAVLLPPKGPMLSGLAAVRTYFIKGFSEATTLSETLTPTKRIVADGLVVDIVLIDATVVIPKETKPLTLHGKMLYIWQRDRDGTWKLARDMWSRI